MKTKFISYWIAGIALSQCLLTMRSEAQLFVQWQAVLGGDAYDECARLYVTDDGGCVVVGGSTSAAATGNKTSPIYGIGADFWMVKLAADGTKQWDQSYGGGGADFAFGVRPALGDGFVLGGYSASAIGGNKTNSLMGGKDYWLVKTDASGGKQWESVFGGTANETCWSLASVADGYLLAGVSFSGATGNKTTPSLGGDDWWVVKVDTNGLKQWEAAYGGEDNEYLYWAEPTSDGGFLLVGESESGITGNKTNASIGLYDGWVVKVDSDGAKQWERVLGGTNQDYLSFAVPTTDGGHLLCGASLSGATGNKTSPNYGNNDWWLVKLDADGELQWDKSYGGSDDDFLKAVLPYQGGYLLFGTSWSGADGNKTVANIGASDYWLIKVDSVGVIEWQQAFGGTNEDYAVEAFAPTPDGGFLLGGYSKSGISGNKNLASFGNYDYWILKLVSAPTLAIKPAGVGMAEVSWSPDIPGFELQERSSLSAGSWSNAPSGVTNPIVVPATLPTKFYRLHQP
jgi:hypothetical protein